MWYSCKRTTAYRQGFVKNMISHPTHIPLILGISCSGTAKNHNSDLSPQSPSRWIRVWMEPRCRSLSLCWLDIFNIGIYLSKFASWHIAKLRNLTNQCNNAYMRNHCHISGYICNWSTSLSLTHLTSQICKMEQVCGSQGPNPVFFLTTSRLPTAMCWGLTKCSSKWPNWWMSIWPSDHEWTA